MACVASAPIHKASHAVRRKKHFDDKGDKGAHRKNNGSAEEEKQQISGAGPAHFTQKKR